MTHLKNFLVLVLTVGVTLIAMEFGSRLIAPNALSGSWMTVDDQGLVINRAGAIATHRRGETSATYRINDHHLRGKASDGDVPSVLVLGDSFTFGWLVENDRTVVSQLQKQADTAIGSGAIRFLNAGTGGWGTASYLDFLTRYVDQINPSAVLVFANATDFSRSIQSGLYQFSADDQTPIRIPHGQSITVQVKRFITGLSLYQWLVENSNLMFILRQAILGAMTSESDAAPPGAEMLQSNKITAPARDVRDFNIALFRELHKVADRHDLPVFIATQYHYQYDPAVYDWLVPIMTDLNVPFLPLQRDMAQATDDKVDGYFIVGDPHPNGALYEILTARVWAWLLPQLRGAVIER